ncbi:MAG: leucine-rich repeat domain-containing protein [Bacteroidales bacterium]|nr:leucine-rich repeat domain-containing protein [Bacteroidales bacterium]
MKKFLVSCLVAVIFFSAAAQKDGFCETYVFHGTLQTDPESAADFTLNFLVLKNDMMVGSFRYDTCSTPYKLAGTMLKGKKFTLVQRNEQDSVMGLFQGSLQKKFESGAGNWMDVATKAVCPFSFQRVVGQSYWDYIKKNRALKEYTSIDKALKRPNKVLSIDVACQGLSALPDEMAKLTNIVSINLLGNQFDTFPPVLGKMTTLDEISLSTNKLSFIGPEIGQCKNLRILIMNANRITELPKEIGELTELLYLDISRCPISTLPEEIKNLTKLQELHINSLSDAEEQRLHELLPNCVIKHF